MKGSRVTSNMPKPCQPHVRHKAFDSVSLKIVDAIPFWPQTATLTEVARKAGVSVGSVMVRLSTVQDTFMVFNHKKSLSRIKDDLSNL